jgi:HlyD family secretion protein
VSAGSTTETITINNPGGYQATGTLTPSQASKVKVGDEALVTVTGVSGALSGTVARVGPVDTSSSGNTYPLVVALPAGSHGIAAGSSARITVTLAEAKDVTVVPTSAVHSGGSGSYVEVLEGGQTARNPVTIGVVGAEYTQIKSKLSPTTRVVLADLSQAVPSSSTSSTTGGLLGGGATFQFSGRGFPAGGRFPAG